MAAENCKTVLHELGKPSKKKNLYLPQKLTSANVTLDCICMPRSSPLKIFQVALHTIPQNQQSQLLQTEGKRAPQTFFHPPPIHFNMELMVQTPPSSLTVFFCSRLIVVTLIKSPHLDRCNLLSSLQYKMALQFKSTLL